MADYISREAAIEKITALINKSGKYTAYESGADDACFILEHEIPAADVRPVVRGNWEKHEDFDAYGGGRFVEWVCSECDKRLRGDWVTRNHIEETPTENFCPNCGADMRGEGTDFSAPLKMTTGEGRE